MAPSPSYSYQSLAGNRLLHFHPRTISAIVLLILMLIILFILHFIVAPKYSTISQHSFNKTEEEGKNAKIINTINLKYITEFTKCPDEDQLIPGSTQMLSGIDITRFNLFSKLNNNSQLEPIFEFTCNSGKLWTNPKDPKSTYTIPDQLESIKYISGDKLQIKTTFNQDYFDFKKLICNRFSLLSQNGNYLGNFANSDTWREMQKEMLGDDNSVFEIYSYYSSLKIQFTNSPNHTKLSRKFIASLTQLPGRYSDLPEAYDQFLNSFGTHTFNAALLGSSLYQQTLIQNDYLLKDDIKNIKIKAVELFLEQVNPEEFNRTGETIDEDDFLKNTKNSFHKFGEIIPWIYAASLRPIEDLIPDDNIKKQVKRAVQIRRIKAQFEELKNFIELAKLKLKREDYKLFEHIRHFLEQEFYHKYEELKVVEEKINEVFEHAKDLKDRNLLHSQKWSIQYNF